MRLSAGMSDALSALLHLFSHDYSWLAQFFSLLLLPFAQEDFAILLGAYVVVNEIMPVALVALCIYGGMVASDFVLYGVGAGARHLPWLRRVAVDDRVRNFSETLKRNLFGIVALCRVVPGVVFVGFVACGWARVSFPRFTMASLTVSALYLPLMLCIAVVFSDTLESRVGWWTWPFLLCMLLAIGYLRRRVFNLREQPGAADDQRPARVACRSVPQPPAVHRIPLGLLYLALTWRWIGFAARYRSLTLPTIVNPRHPPSGMWSESKSAYLGDVMGPERGRVAEFIAVTRSVEHRTLFADLERIRQLLYGAGLEFPLIAKPDVGPRGAVRIDDVPALREYLRYCRPGGKFIRSEERCVGEG